jgi:inorganic pyrophosphatase
MEKSAKTLGVRCQPVGGKRSKGKGRKQEIIVEVDSEKEEDMFENSDVAYSDTEEVEENEEPFFLEEYTASKKNLSETKGPHIGAI